MSDDLQPLIDRLAADPQQRARLATLLAQDLASATPQSFWTRARPFLAGLSSAAVVLLAFLVPSMQDQWDRFKTREAIERYAQVGASLMQDEHYESAEQAYGRALELAGNQRLDLLEGQLRARVMRVYDDPAWNGKNDETITEADFLYLLELESARDKPAQRAATVGAYGVFLAGLKRWTEAESRLKEAAALDPKAAAPHIHLGNLFDDLGRSADAEAQYRAAIALNPREPNAHYDLGLLLEAAGRHSDAAAEFARSVQAAPQDVSNRIAWIEALQAEGKTAEAWQQCEAALRLAPDNAELSALAKRLRPSAAPQR